MVNRHRENPLSRRPLGDMIKEAEKNRGKAAKEKRGEIFGELYGRGLGEMAQHPERLREIQRKLAEIERVGRKKTEKDLEKARRELERKLDKGKMFLEEYVYQETLEAAVGQETALEAKIKSARTVGGEKLPAGEVQRITRDFYLNELGYSVRYKSQRGNWLARKCKDLLRLRATVIDKEGHLVLDKSGRPVEFKTAWTPGGETEFITFLKEKFLEKAWKEAESVGRAKGLKEEPKEPTLRDYVEENLTKRLNKEEEKLTEAVIKRRTGKEEAGKKWTEEDVDFAIHDYYLEILGYTRKTRAGAIFWSERFVDKQGKYIVDEKTRKPVKVRSLKKANEFLKAKLEEKIKKDLEEEAKLKGLE